MEKSDIESDLQKIFSALKVSNTKQALQKIELYDVWNKHDVSVIEKLRKEIKELKSGQGKHN